MLIVMSGLPGTGKTALATRLAVELHGVILSKDTVRAALFPPPVLDYSQAQDDLCMAAVYRAAVQILETAPSQAVLVDGRTFLRSYQVVDLLACTASVKQAPHIIECVCADAVARKRLDQDRVRGEHGAGNRTFALYRTLQAAAQAISLPHLTLDTGKMPLQRCVALSLEYLSKS